MVGKTKKRGASKNTDMDESMEFEDIDTEVESNEVKKPRAKSRVAPRVTTKSNYMDDAELARFTKILEAWKNDLMQEVDHTITEMKQAEILADPNDRATREEDYNRELRTRDRERKLIRKIEEALQQIKDKEYGYCEACGIEIGVRRLEARPTATLCIDCKTLAEIQEKRA